MHVDQRKRMRVHSKQVHSTWDENLAVMSRRHACAHVG